MDLKSRLTFFFLLSWACISFSVVESMCISGCDLALASYYIWIGSNLTYISNIMESRVLSEPEDIINYNQDHVRNPDVLQVHTRVNVPFPCDCINGEFLGHIFRHEFHEGDTYPSVAGTVFSNLTTDAWLQSTNIYGPTSIPVLAKVDVTVNCSCGDIKVSKDYGLFITYPLRAEDTLESIAEEAKLQPHLLQRYNPGVDFSRGNGLVFIPGKDENGVYVPLHIRKAGLDRVVAGVSIGGTCGLLLFALCIYMRYFRKKEGEEAKFPPKESMEPSIQDDSKIHPAANGSAGFKYIMMDRSSEFSYEELANATNDFNLANKIGQGGFGEVYYAELRGEKVAIKKMKIQASREFLAELKVLTSVHHLNLVRLIGYCVERSLFLVYEYMDNGNLSQHLRESERELMTWSTRLQIALDVARGLEYIHDYTVPVYIHRDIKPDNILLNKNFNAKVADFGLTKLTDIESSAINTDHMAGTFGYMPPENALGRVSRKIDVYAFGVVLYELISAKEAVVEIKESSTELKSLEIKTDEPSVEFKSLVALFDEVIDHEGNPIEGLRKLVDPRLGENYSIDSIREMAQLAKACTDRDPKQRPPMRSVVVVLMALNSATDDRMSHAEVNSSRAGALSPTVESL
uniref:non-specific serine/threonine protein kinase n=1 Tax=Lotus japonicus TaxID=34305 RepID=A8WHB5_LOTJA|nr:LysM type receptor kinase [Lotus japonicus]CAN88847.1 TPA: LysM receptor kinase 1b [Lotus japonicus]